MEAYVTVLLPDVLVADVSGTCHVQNVEQLETGSLV